MMETMFPPIDIHEETLLKFEKEYYIDEHGSYFMNISSNPCLHEKSPPILPHTRYSTPSFSLFIKTLKGWF
jgi:hypothetical protein